MSCYVIPYITFGLLSFGAPPQSPRDLAIPPPEVPKPYPGVIIMMILKVIRRRIPTIIVVIIITNMITIMITLNLNNIV